MSEEEIIDILEDRDMFIDTLYENYRQSAVKPFDKAIQGLLDLYQKEKEKNKELDKIKFIITNNLPPDMKYVCYCNTDFERLFGNDYVSKYRIKELKDKFIKDSKDEKVFMTQSSQINASIIQFCNELLEERN